MRSGGRLQVAAEVREGRVCTLDFLAQEKVRTFVVTQLLKELA